MMKQRYQELCAKLLKLDEVAITYKPEEGYVLHYGQKEQRKEQRFHVNYDNAKEAIPKARNKYSGGFLNSLFSMHDDIVCNILKWYTKKYNMDFGEKTVDKQYLTASYQRGMSPVSIEYDIRDIERTKISTEEKKYVKEMAKYHKDEKLAQVYMKKGIIGRAFEHIKKFFIEDDMKKQLLLDAPNEKKEWTTQYKYKVEDKPAQQKNKDEIKKKPVFDRTI